MPASPPIEPLVALNVPVPTPSMLTPSLALLVELTESHGSVLPELLTTSTAGPPVALASDWPADGMLNEPAVWTLKAGEEPETVVSCMSFPLPSPNAVPEPVVPASFTPPLPEFVTVMSSNVLAEPRLVVPAPAAASRPAAPFVVIEIVPVEAKFTVPVLLSFTPVSPVVAELPSPLLTVRFETLVVVPLFVSSSAPGWVPLVPLSTTYRPSSVTVFAPRPVPKMPPPV